MLPAKLGAERSPWPGRSAKGILGGTGAAGARGANGVGAGAGGGFAGRTFGG